MMIILGWYGSHTYLNEFISENLCKRIMEIGVYNGDNAVSMIKAAKKKIHPEKIEYYGFDFFSYYNIDTVEEKLKPLRCKYQLFKGNTLQTLLGALKYLPKMDLIFIDGGKSFREAWSDWEYSSKLIHKDSAIFIHNVDFSGVKRMVEEIPRKMFDVVTFKVLGEGMVSKVKLK